MSALADLSAHFLAMERLVELQPEGVTAEIARGVYSMSPRPRGGHGVAQGRLFARLDAGAGSTSGSEAPEWLFIIEPEIRSIEAFSRLVPDVAGWRRSAEGWGALDATPIPRVPEWVAEVLSPGTETFDRGPKTDAYGFMGVGWLWLLDPARRAVETYANERGKMIPGPAFRSGDAIAAPPFEGLRVPVSSLFLAL